MLSDVLAWMLIALLVLRFTPEQRTAAIGDFFKKVIPTLPITGILKFFEKRKKYRKKD